VWNTILHTLWTVPVGAQRDADRAVDNAVCQWLLGPSKKDSTGPLKSASEGGDERRWVKFDHSI